MMKIAALGMGLLLVAVSAVRIYLRDAVPVILSRALVADDEKVDAYAQKHPEFRKEALRRNPVSPVSWCRLGSALLDSGHTQQARYCFERALKLGPNFVPGLWLTAEFYNRIREPRSALACTSRILELTPAFRGEILATYTAEIYDPADILNYGLPSSAPVAREYFQGLVRTSNRKNLARAWDWITSRSYEDDPLANQYIDFLLQDRDYDGALAVWLRRLKQPGGSYRVSDYIYNGGFETEPRGSVFDWRINPVDGVETSYDTAVAHSGRRSLEILFEGKANLGYEHISQDVVLKPGNYLFKAFIRTSEITTDKGIGFRVYDPDAPVNLDMRTKQLRGTGEWTELETPVPVKEQTKRIRVQVVRDRSEKFDDKIKGTAWIDDVRLIPQ
jgi:tetratricopeptide (TPR) repeat protein